jgi:hydroxymethylglutaryl-CoA lyase
MQGLHDFIPTDTKIDYLNTLLKVGFEVLDCGSFVSPKAIPQMRDTKEVLANLDTHNSATKLLVIVANQRGAEQACLEPKVSFLGYPFSVSETFQLRNTNANIRESVKRLEEIQALAQSAQKETVAYISMGFGNPYGDEWSVDIVQKWVDIIADMGIRSICLSDTVGMASAADISYLFKNLLPPYPEVAFGAHFHTRPNEWKEKIEAAYLNGCTRFDGAIKGYGGCPMATDELTGNMPTENLLGYFSAHSSASLAVPLRLDMEAFARAMQVADKIFPKKNAPLLY